MTAYVGDECIFDLCGGGKTKGTTTTPESLFLIMSASKAVSSILMAMMVSRGHLKYEEKVATYWPEFAQHGKENLKVEDIMRHEGGMHKLDTLLKPSDILRENIKNNSMGQIIENDKAAWFPGNPRKYHATTRDFITNEIFRRVDPEGRTMGEFMESEFK